MSVPVMTHTPPGFLFQCPWGGSITIPVPPSQLPGHDPVSTNLSKMQTLSFAFSSVHYLFPFPSDSQSYSRLYCILVLNNFSAISLLETQAVLLSSLSCQLELLLGCNVSQGRILCYLHSIQRWGSSHKAHSSTLASPYCMLHIWVIVISKEKSNKEVIGVT